jgi:ATP-dependent Clp protease, protease subunit
MMMSQPIHMQRDEEKTEKLVRDAVSDQWSFKSRFVLVFGEINHAMARATCERLIALAEESDAPIRMLVSSPGGHVESGDAIHDMIRFVRAPVTTIGSGWVASAGAHIFLAAEKKRRVCLPNTRFMIHQPAGGAGGPAADIAIQAKEILRTRERLAHIISKETGQPLERVRVDIERDFWMSAEEAIQYGMVSKVIERYSDV